MKERKLLCLRCWAPMKYERSSELQLGRSNPLFPGLPGMTESSIPVDVYICQGCGKIELFQTQKEEK